MAGIYLHIPFCKRICGYCDFYKSARTSLLDRVVERMLQEMEERKEFLKGQPVKTLYLGGGTPSLCSPEQISGLVETARKLFRIGDGEASENTDFEEVTLEANPDDLTPEFLEGVRKGGIDRLSIGIQSFDDRVLKWMNRRHTARQAIEAVEAARRAGFERLTIDLIFGLPNFGGEVLERSIEQALALDVEHISAYHLTIEPNTLFGRKEARGELQAVEEQTSEEEFLRIHNALTGAGYEHYEVSNFARKGHRARHNSAYWQGVPYLGIGPAAHSYDGERRIWSVDTVESYAEAGARRFEEELLSEHDHFSEYLMTRLRTAEGISTEEMAARFGKERADKTLKRAEAALAAGNLLLEGTTLRIPAERFLLSDWVIECLME